MDSVSHNATYSPSSEVAGFHKVTHLNSHLQARSGDFGITAESQWNSYTRSLYPLPIICGGLALVAVVLFQLGFSLYYFWRDKKALPPVNDQRIPTDPLRNCRIMFVLMLTVVAVYVQFIPVGNSYLTVGISNSNNRLDYLDSTFTSLTTSGAVMYADGNRLQQDFSSAYSINNCTAAQQLDDSLPWFYVSVGEYLSHVEDVPDKAKDFQDGLNLYAVKFKNNAIWWFYGCLIACSDMFVVGMFFSSRRIVFVAVGWAELIMCFIFLACLAGMVILMCVADYCMEPTANLLQLSPEKLLNTTLYYTTCVGVNPLQPPLDAVEQLAQQTAAGVQAALDTSCPGDAFLLDALQVISAISSTISTTKERMACAPIQSSLVGLLEVTFCKDTFRGLYTIWQAIFISGGSMFVMVVVCAIATFYFPKGSDEAKIEAAHVPYQDAGAVYESYTSPNSNAHVEHGEAPERDTDDEEDDGAPLSVTETLTVEDSPGVYIASKEDAEVVWV